MFCPRCGKAEQVPETYCRQCGFFLPDLLKPVKREIPPEEHLKANSVLNLLTIIVSFTLSILLFAFFGFRSGTHPLIYATIGLLIAIGGWHIQTFIRTRQLERQWKRRAPLTETASHKTEYSFESASTAKLLDQADLADTIPASVTENTTKHMAERPRPKS